MKSIVIGIHLQKNDVEPVARAMKAGDLFASVFDVDDERPLGDRDLLLEVSSVRARLLDAATFVAVRYGLAVRDENELAAKCSGMTQRWRQLLVAHRDEVEMTLKAAAAAPPPRPNRRDFKSGAEYLRALHEATNAVDIDPDFRRGVERALIPIAPQHRWIRDSSSVELAMLVRRADLDAVRVAGESLRRDYPRMPFLLSGPWPLEVFTDDDQQ
jgi:hypothetical protein